jgi:uncharacterized membrane protein
VDTYAWLLAFHLLAAFAIAAALVLFSVLVVSGRRMRTLEETQLLFRLAPIGAPLIGAGSVLALVLGIVLALKSSDFDLWDGWVIAAIVLWALLAPVGARTGAYYTRVQKIADAGEPGAEGEVIARLQAPTGMLLHLATLAIFALILLDMLFKPGA